MKALWKNGRTAEGRSGVHETDIARDNRSALHCAANDAAVRALTSVGVDINLKDGKGRTPLHYACKNGHCGVVVFLLLKGARAQEDFEKEWSTLHLAAANNHPGVIEDLISFGNVPIERHDTLGRSGTRGVGGKLTKCFTYCSRE